MDVSGRKLNVALNSKVLKEVECLKYLGSKITVDESIEIEVKSE